MPRYTPTHEDMEQGHDEPGLPICIHCNGQVCTFKDCPKEECLHGGSGMKLESGKWVCGSTSCLLRELTAESQRLGMYDFD